MNYQKALEQAILYIEQHLYEEVKVEDVASFAGYSYYHFNRQFVAILGESVGSYIKKRRLANAAQKLLYTDDKIINIAIEHCFESNEAFSRAFKTLYKVTPQEYRKNRIQTFVSTKEHLNHKLLNHLLHHVNVHPKIVQLPKILVAGIQNNSELNVNAKNSYWKEFYKQVDTIPNQVKPARYFGLYNSCNKTSHFSLNEEMPFEELIGVEVYSHENIPDTFHTETIESSRYAVFTHKGSLKTLSQTIDYIWGTWLLSTKEEITANEVFELYDERFLGFDNPDSEMDIYIPIL